MGNTSIEWTNKTWNPVRGCSVVSEGCRNCYAMQIAARFNKPGQAYEGLAYRNESGAHWTGKVQLIPEHLDDPLHWKKPCRIFVNSMSDLFHESLTEIEIGEVFSVMARCPQHIFQVLTKRPKVMLETLRTAQEIFEFDEPLPNVWLGVSVEDQKTADERIPLLLETPAAVRWVSAEPLLGPIDLTTVAAAEIKRPPSRWGWNVLAKDAAHIDWLVVGGESGPGARPMRLAWAETIIRQCEQVGVPVFVKQLGKIWAKENHADNKKGGDPSEWPYQQILNRREFPSAA